MCVDNDKPEPPRNGGGDGLFGPKKHQSKPDPDGWKNSGWVKKDEGDGWTLWGDP